MTDSLTLKRRFFGENIGEFRFSKAAISLQRFELLEILIGCFFSLLNKLPPKDTNLSTVLVSDETPRSKFPTNQISATFSDRPQCLFGYNVTFRLQET